MGQRLFALNLLLGALLPLPAWCSGASGSATAARADVGRIESLDYISVTDLERQLRTTAMSAFAARGMHLVNAQVLWDGARRPTSPGRAQVRMDAPLAERTMPQLPLRVMIDETGGDHLQGVARIVGRLEQDTPILVRSIPRGAQLSCDDLRVEARPVRVPRPDLLPLPCALGETRVLRRPLSAGDALRLQDVGAPPAVAEMTPVMIRVRNGAVVLESGGVALADGEIGQTVRVRPGMSRDVIEARVVAPGSVVPVEGASQ